MKVGAAVTGADELEEFLPEEGGAKEEGWSESNMAAKLFCRTPQNMRHLQRLAEENFLRIT